MKSTPLFSTLSILPLLTVGLDLGSSSDYWGLPGDTLDTYTSHACRTAYEASIDCSDTLLAIVASPDPQYLPSTSDLDNICTDTCRDSLKSYIKYVEEVCSSTLDATLISTAALCEICRVEQTSVETIGKLLQYKLESACALDSDDDYCYLHPPREGTDFPCTDTCSIDYYKTAHSFKPINELKVSKLQLVKESNYWKRDFENGYKRAMECESK